MYFILDKKVKIHFTTRMPISPKPKRLNYPRVVKSPKVSKLLYGHGQSLFHLRIILLLDWINK